LAGDDASHEVKFIGSNLSLPFPMGQTHLSEEKKMVGKGWESQVQIFPITNNGLK
jgi:hypothetical protein